MGSLLSLLYVSRTELRLPGLHGKGLKMDYQGQLALLTCMAACAQGSSPTAPQLHRASLLWHKLPVPCMVG